MLRGIPEGTIHASITADLAHHRQTRHRQLPEDWRSYLHRQRWGEMVWYVISCVCSDLRRRWRVVLDSAMDSRVALYWTLSGTRKEPLVSFPPPPIPPAPAQLSGTGYPLAVSATRTSTGIDF